MASASTRRVHVTSVRALAPGAGLPHVVSVRLPISGQTRRVSIRGMAGESLTTRERKRKLGFERKSELVRWALERGLLR